MKVTRIGRRRFGRLQARLIALVVGLCGLIAPALVPTPAQAVSYCTSGTFCVWENIYGEGYIFRMPVPVSNLKMWGWNDVASSAQNLTTQRWCLYEHADYGGRVIYFESGAAYWDFTQSGWNDIVSSARPC